METNAAEVTRAVLLLEEARAMKLVAREKAQIMAEVAVVSAVVGPGLAVTTALVVVVAIVK